MKKLIFILMTLMLSVQVYAGTTNYNWIYIPKYPDAESANYPTYMDNFMNDVDTDVWSIQQNKLTADVTAPSNITALTPVACTIQDADGGLISCIDVSWTDSINTDINYYEVRYMPQGGSAYLYAQTTVLSIRLTGLVGNTIYCISVKGVDKQGNTSGYPADNCTVTSGVDSSINPPTSATALAGFKQVWIDWTNPADKDLAVIEIWRADTNDRAGAAKIAEVKTDFYADVLGNSVIKYYWARAKDLSGNFSTWEPVGATSGISATTLTIATADIGAAQITNTTIANATIDLAAKVSGQLPNANLAQITDAAKLADAIISAAKIQTGAVDKTKFVTGLSAIEKVTILPTLPDAAYPEGYTVFLTTDDKLYRSTGSTWTTAVPTTDLSGQITTTQITDDAITSPKILAGTIVASDIATGTITANEISTNAITADEILAGAVIAGKIAANAVTATEIAADSITSAKIVTGTITASDIGAGVITGTLIAADTIAAGNIAAGAITSSEINADAVTTDKISAGAVQTTDIQAGAITSTHVSTNQIITATANIGDGLITSAKIADATIATADIGSAQITTGLIADATITSADIASATITAANIANATITDAQIANATITSAKIASLSADKISAGTITGSTIQTAASPNKRFVVSNSDNEAHFIDANNIERVTIGASVYGGGINVAGGQLSISKDGGIVGNPSATIALTPSNKATHIHFIPAETSFPVNTGWDATGSVYVKSDGTINYGRGTNTWSTFLMTASAAILDASASLVNGTYSYSTGDTNRAHRFWISSAYAATGSGGIVESDVLWNSGVWQLRLIVSNQASPVTYYYKAYQLYIGGSLPN